VTVLRRKGYVQVTICQETTGPLTTDDGTAAHQKSKKQDWGGNLKLEFVLSRFYKYVAPTALAAGESQVVVCQRGSLPLCMGYVHKMDIV
jgi:hypothetical protein